MTVQELINAMEATGVRRNEVHVVIDGMDTEGLALNLAACGVRVKGSSLAIIANPVSAGEPCPNRYVDGPCTAPGCDGA